MTPAETKLSPEQRGLLEGIIFAHDTDDADIIVYRDRLAELILRYDAARNLRIEMLEKQQASPIYKFHPAANDYAVSETLSQYSPGKLAQRQEQMPEGECTPAAEATAHNSARGDAAWYEPVARMIQHTTESPNLIRPLDPEGSEPAGRFMNGAELQAEFNRIDARRELDHEGEPT